MSSFAKGNPFLFFFWDPLFSCFLFFLALQRLARLKCNLEPYLGVIILQPHACTQRFRLPSQDEVKCWTDEC